MLRSPRGRRIDARRIAAERLGAQRHRRPDGRPSDRLARRGAPLAWADAQARLDGLSFSVADLEASRRRRGGRLDLERAESELRSLSAGRRSGSGARRLGRQQHGARAGAAAALLSSSCDVAGLPFRLRTDSGGAALAGDTEAPWSVPFVTTAETVPALAGPPARELPGLRTLTPSAFDITPVSCGSVELGQVLDATLHLCTRSASITPR
jgi:hypothetical protein